MIKEIWRAYWGRFEINDMDEKNTKETPLRMGSKIRIDTTVVESNIHSPYDSDLFVDTNYVIIYNNDTS